MKQILVIVPFPMSNENLAARRAQLDAVELSDALNLLSGQSGRRRVITYLR